MSAIPTNSPGKAALTSAPPQLVPCKQQQQQTCCFSANKHKMHLCLMIVCAEEFWVSHTWVNMCRGSALNQQGGVCPCLSLIKNSNWKKPEQFTAVSLLGILERKIKVKETKVSKHEPVIESVNHWISQSVDTPPPPQPPLCSAPKSSQPCVSQPC